MAAPLLGAAAAAAAAGGGGGGGASQQQLLRPPRKYTPSETTQVRISNFTLRLISENKDKNKNKENRRRAIITLLAVASHFVSRFYIVNARDCSCDRRRRLGRNKLKSAMCSRVRNKHEILSLCAQVEEEEVKFSELRILFFSIHSSPPPPPTGSLQYIGTLGSNLCWSRDGGVFIEAAIHYDLLRRTA